MKAEWNQIEVLCAYDVRGIQDYIFRTNKISDAMGASRIIEGIISKAMKTAVEELHITESVLLDWESDEGRKADRKKLRFAEQKSVSLQVLYVGGGNAYALFRTGSLAEQINRKMARYVLEKSYSLQLAAAAVPYTGNYYKDFRELSREMAAIKGKSPVSRLTGALPVMEVEPVTGFPAVKLAKEHGKEEWISYETYQKRMTKQGELREGIEKNLDALVTEKGIDSMIAIVHLDGNNMGSRIQLLMGEETDYTKAVDRIRQISMNINHGFKDTLNQMREVIEAEAVQKEVFRNKEKNVFVRPLLAAGDDITFLCNASVAMAAVEYFCRDISGKVLYQEPGEEKDLEIYGFSVCAGIAYINSHFPFRVGYRAAENCCDSAKKRAKEDVHKAVVQKNGRMLERVGSWVDFQICKSIQAADIKANRKKEYELYDKSRLCLRPYFISVQKQDVLNQQCARYDFSIFKETYQYFSNKALVPRSVAKEFRNTYPMGEHEMQALQSFARSRGRQMPARYPEAFRLAEDGRKEAVWYDALELMDYYLE